MRFKRLFPNISHLSVLVHSDTGAPYAMRLDVHRIFQLLLRGGVLFIGFFLGTLLFFRELETTRQLEERVLELEIQSRLSEDLVSFRKESNLDSAKKTGQPVVAQSKISTSVTSSPPKQEANPEVAKQVSRSVAKAPAPAQTIPKKPVAKAKTVAAKFSKLTISCDGTSCKVNVGLLPSKPGRVAGELVLVLELETLQAATVKAGKSSKQFILYPGYEKRKSFAPSQLSKISGNAFKFNRRLNRTVLFTLGKVARPIAVNAYLFDGAHKVIQHKRQLVDIQP